MRITGFNIRFFSIPFKEAISVAGNPLQQREGFVLGLCDDRQQWGFGEAAPLPGLEPVTNSQCRDELCQLKQHLVGCHLDSACFDLTKPLLGLIPTPDHSPLDDMTASVWFGLESALLQLYLRNHPDLLLKPGDNLAIPVNGLFIPSNDSNRLEQQSQALKQDGFDTIKVKIGRIAQDLEVEQILRLADFFDGEINLRLDGNRSLTPEAYKQFFSRLGSLKIEYVEEPLPAGMWEEALAIQWPLALDESLGEFLDEQGQDLGKLPRQIRHIIAKPTAAKGVHGLCRLLVSAAEKGIQVVLSSAFNTGLGLSTMGLLSHLATSSNPTAHGLDTLKYLSGDLLAEPLSISQGKLHIPVSLITSETRFKTRFLSETAVC